MPPVERVRNTPDVCRALRALNDETLEGYAKIVSAEHAELLRKRRADRESREELDRALLEIGRSYPETSSAVQSARALADRALSRPMRNR